MTQRSMTIIITITVIILIVFVYIFSVPPRGEKIGPPDKDTTAIRIDSASHAVTIDK